MLVPDCEAKPPLPLLVLVAQRQMGKPATSSIFRSQIVSASLSNTRAENSRSVRPSTIRMSVPYQRMIVRHGQSRLRTRSHRTQESLGDTRGLPRIRSGDKKPVEKRIRLQRRSALLDEVRLHRCSPTGNGAASCTAAQSSTVSRGGNLHSSARRRKWTNPSTGSGVFS